MDQIQELPGRNKNEKKMYLMKNQMDISTKLWQLQ